MKLVFVSAALFASSMVNAATPIDGWYTGVFGGYTYLPNNISITHDGLTRSNASYQSGYDAGGSIGYKSNPMRYEGEITYLYAHLKNFKLNRIQQNGVKGHGEALLAMANVYYDFPNLLYTLQPFLGFGIGYGWLNAKLNSTGPLIATQYSGTNTLFTYQAMAGLTYNFSENYALNLGYRYVSTSRANELGKRFQANLASVGAVYRFDEGSYK